MDRYDGKPFLRLLDSYLLDAIGQLTDKQHEGLSAMEPKLRAVFNHPGPWQEIVRTQMDLPPSFPASVQKMWEGFLSAAKAQGISVGSTEFVERFVDENFPEVRSARH